MLRWRWRSPSDSGAQPPAGATTWDQIGRYLRLIQSVGIEAMVANDCPLGLFGAYHAGREVLLMCGNNIPDDPAVVWEVLAMSRPMRCRFARGEPDARGVVGGRDGGDHRQGC